MTQGAPGPGGRPRRAPTPDERRVDPERTKAALVAAALDEFAAKGFAGATVREIAARAGVSKDLIAYHFGGKLGLYQAVQKEWIARRDAFVDRSLPLEDNLAAYLHAILSDPRPMRLLVRRGLTETGADYPELDDDAFPRLADLTQRQQQGEIDPDVDPATLQLVLLGAVAAPVLFPDRIRRLFDLDVDDPGFEARYLAGLRHLLGTTHASSGRRVPSPRPDSPQRKEVDTP